MSTRTTTLCLVAGLLLAPACGDRAPAADGDNPFFSHGVLNIAHRGGNQIAPEATIPAFESALEVGADVLEMDFRATADGVLMVIHDQTVDRTTDGTGRVDELSFAEIRALDAGYDFTLDGGATYPFRGAGLRIPTLEEVLSRFQGTPMNIEIKAENPPSVIEPFVALLDRYEMRDRVLVASFSDELIAAFRSAAPDVATSMSPAEVALLVFLTPEQEATYAPPARFVQVPPTFSGIEVLTAELVERAHRFGLYVHGWDVDDRMTQTIELGVDGLIVDDPAALEALLAGLAVFSAG